MQVSYRKTDDTCQEVREGEMEKTDKPTTQGPDGAGTPEAPTHHPQESDAPSPDVRSTETTPGKVTSPRGKLPPLKRSSIPKSPIDCC